MDQETTVLIKEEEIVEFPKDALLLGEPSFHVKQERELMCHVDGSEHNECTLVTMYQETAMLIKKEEIVEAPDEPDSMGIKHPLYIGPSFHVKQEHEFKHNVDDSELNNTDIITVKEELNLEFEELEFEELECQDYRPEEFGTKVIELLGLQKVPADTDVSKVSTYQNDQGSSQIVIKEETEFGTKVIELLGLQNVPVYTDASEVSTCQDDQESSQIVIKEEIDCDSDDGSVSGLDSLHFADKVADTTLRRSSRRRCLRFSVVDLQESSSDETPVSKHKKKVRKRHLAQYTPTHSASKPYSCGLCGKTFSRSDNLKEHEMLHSGEKYRCAECGREFSQPRQLGRHVRSHARARGNSCCSVRTAARRSAGGSPCATTCASTPASGRSRAVSAGRRSGRRRTFVTTRASTPASGATAATPAAASSSAAHI